MSWLVNGKEAVKSEPIDDRFSVLSDQTRRKIMEKVSEKPRYPAEIAKEMGVDKQKIYYHFEKLEEAELVKPSGRKEVSGGTATYYTSSVDALSYCVSDRMEKILFQQNSKAIERFLNPLLTDSEINGDLIVGSPDQHGEYEVRARDGHLAGEIAAKLGNLGYTDQLDVKLDTEVSELEDGTLLLGGILTNTFAKQLNGEFPVKFSTEEFPFHSLETSENTYKEDSIGVISRAEVGGKTVFLIAGIRNRGTKAAVVAFRDIEQIVKDFNGGEFFRVVRGQDLNGDGKIDHYEVVE